MGHDQDIDLVHAEVESTITLTSTSSAQWPGGWPGDIEASLVDAVFSARATYRTKRGRGVHRLVRDWRVQRHDRSPSLEALVADIERAGVSGWASDVVHNNQHSPGRSRSAPHGPTKAATVLDAASHLIGVGINTAEDVTPDTSPGARAALMSVKGVGYATANYFFMLLGAPGVKPDRMIHRFVKRALQRRLTDAQAEKVIAAVASRIGVKSHELDHAIWKYESGQAAARDDRSP